MARCMSPAVRRRRCSSLASGARWARLSRPADAVGAAAFASRGVLAAAAPCRAVTGRDGGARGRGPGPCDVNELVECCYLGGGWGAVPAGLTLNRIILSPPVQPSVRRGFLAARLGPRQRAARAHERAHVHAHVHVHACKCVR
mmetsp:Transcript_92085/g.240250  ORF Transcript_92085/g.240250 Transcript_92085/m.240250 type:complete len:143 (+) Transcript_92085:92-520(+)